MKHPNKKIMEKAIELAKKKKAVAVIIVKGDKIISQGTTTVYDEKQPFRHAEINAIEKACKKFKSFDRNEVYTQRILIPCEKVLKYGTPKLKLYKEFMRKECKPLLLL